MKITGTVLAEGWRAENFHFTLYNIDYEREEILKEKKQTEPFDYTKEHIRLQSQTIAFDTYVEYENINGQTVSKTYQVKKDTTPVKKVVHDIYEQFQMRKFEGIALKLKDGEYTVTTIPKETIERIIRSSMKEAKIEGEDLTTANKRAIESSFSTLLRQTNKTVASKSKPKPLSDIHKSKRQ